MWWTLFHILVFSSPVAPFAFIYFLMKAIRKVVKDENYDNYAMAAGICLLWLMGSVASLSVLFSYYC